MACEIRGKSPQRAYHSSLSLRRLRGMGRVPAAGPCMAQQTSQKLALTRSQGLLMCSSARQGMLHM